MILSILFASLVGLTIDCRKNEIVNNQIQEYIGKDFTEFNKNGIILTKDMCSPYSVAEKQTETDSTIVFIYSSKNCLDAEFEVIINKKTNKIIKIRPLSLS